MAKGMAEIDALFGQYLDEIELDVVREIFKNRGAETAKKAAQAIVERKMAPALAGAMSRAPQVADVFGGMMPGESIGDTPMVGRRDLGAEYGLKDTGPDFVERPKNPYTTDRSARVKARSGMYEAAGAPEEITSRGSAMQARNRLERETKRAKYAAEKAAIKGAFEEGKAGILPEMEALKKQRYIPSTIVDDILGGTPNLADEMGVGKKAADVAEDAAEKGLKGAAGAADDVAEAGLKGAAKKGLGFAGKALAGVGVVLTAAELLDWLLSGTVIKEANTQARLGQNVLSMVAGADEGAELRGELRANKQIRGIQQSRELGDLQDQVSDLGLEADLGSLIAGNEMALAQISNVQPAAWEDPMLAARMLYGQLGF